MKEKKKKRTKSESLLYTSLFRAGVDYVVGMMNKPSYGMDE